MDYLLCGILFYKAMAIAIPLKTIMVFGLTRI